MKKYKAYGCVTEFEPYKVFIKGSFESTQEIVTLVKIEVLLIIPPPSDKVTKKIKKALKVGIWIDDAIWNRSID